MSAYDMKVSDAIYGHADRYVSRNRLQAMLDREFDLDVEAAGAGARRYYFVLRVRRYSRGAELSWHQRVPRLDGNENFRAAPTISPVRL